MTSELLQKLFSYTDTVEFNGVLLYMRLPSEQEFQDAQKKALLDARRLRKALRDPSTEDFLLYIDPVYDLSKDQLIQELIQLGMRSVIRTYLATTPKPALPKLSDFPSQEEQENYVAAEEERETQYNESLQAYVADWEKNYRASLQQKSIEEIRELYRLAKTDIVCEDRFARQFETYLLVASLYTDPTYTTKAFTVEEFQHVPRAFRDVCLKVYNKLQLSSEDLKK
jgi:hypothetical protein